MDAHSSTCSETTIAGRKRSSGELAPTVVEPGGCCSSEPRLSASKLAKSNESVMCLPAACSASIVLDEGSLAARLWAVERVLGRQLENSIEYGGKVEYVYNPLDYAETLHLTFLRKFLLGVSKTKVLFLGMNPGPFGMVQTGVPFGDIPSVRDWMKISGPVGRPVKEHPKRPVQGLDCRRKEPSGQRFWSFFAKLCGTPERFFREAYVQNYCPVAYLDFKGKNITPVDMEVQVRRQVENLCDSALQRTLGILGCEMVVAVGKYAEQKAKAAVESLDLPITVACIMHPSPANPAANGGKWEISVEASLRNLGLYELFMRHR